MPRSSFFCEATKKELGGGSGGGSGGSCQQHLPLSLRHNPKVMTARSFTLPTRAEVKKEMQQHHERMEGERYELFLCKPYLRFDVRSWSTIKLWGEKKGEQLFSERKLSITTGEKLKPWKGRRKGLASRYFRVQYLEVRTVLYLFVTQMSCYCCCCCNKIALSGHHYSFTQR